MRAVLPAGPLRDAGAVIEIFRAQRETLEKMAVTTCDIDQEPLPPGLRLTLRIYIRILEDGLSVLNSIIDYAERHMD